MNSKIIEDLNWRYACKQFDSTKKLSKEQVDTLLESLRLTASSYGIQPWKFVHVKNTELREKLVDASYGQSQVLDASDLIVLCRPAKIDGSIIDSYLEDIAKTRGQELDSLEGFKTMLMRVVDKPEDKTTAWAKNQIYIALGTLMTVCAMMRIDSCPMEGFVPSKYNEILGLDDLGLKAVLVCPVGYRSSEDKYIDILKVRYATEDVITVI